MDLRRLFSPFGIRYRNNEERRYENDMHKASSLASLIESAQKNGIDIFDPNESTGYVKNNNEQIKKFLSTVNPNFDLRTFMEWVKRVFAVVGTTPAYAELDESIKPYVDEKFDFSSFQLDRDNFTFSASYLHLYIRGFKTGEEILQVFVSTKDADPYTADTPNRYFVRFKRPAQFKIQDYRRVKSIVCPYCGAPVVFTRGDSEECPYCKHYVVFEEYQWKLFEIEKITADTVIDNWGLK